MADPAHPSRCVAWLLCLVLASAAGAEEPAKMPYVIVLGIAQDAGYPQAGCRKPCCERAWKDPRQRRHVVCLGVVDPASGRRWMFEATPDFREQLETLNAAEPPSTGAPAGIFLTHAHIGHYTGLMHVGHEVMGARDVPVHAMPRMREFLSTNGPWDQLVSYRNVRLEPLAADTAVPLTERITVTPFLVPHRDEYSETVGFRIDGPDQSVAFIPDIDKWERWDRRLETLLAEVDVVYVDGTFYENGEIPGRDMSRIPHPFIVETMDRLRSLPEPERGKIRFTHLNHTNPALRPGSEARRTIEAAGFRIAEEGETVPLGSPQESPLHAQ